MAYIRRAYGLFVTSAVLLLVLSGVAVAAAPGTTSRATDYRLDVQEFAQTQEAVEAYWTPERMRAAEPMDLLVADGSPAGAAGTEGFGQQGPAETFAPAGPAGSGLEVSPLVQDREDLFTPASYPWPFNRYEQAAPYTQFPISTMGRLFFTTPWGPSSCSGTVVVSFNRSLIWTAGHCLHGGPGVGWYSNFAFAPAYRDGATPLGLWTGIGGTVLTDWSMDGNLRYDLAGLRVAPNASGQRIQDVTGAQGMKFNWGLYWYTNFGYPAVSPFTGQRLIVCVANWATLDNPPGSGPSTIGKGCDMTGGASGGGWHTDFSGAGGYVESVNSYRYGNQPLALYGPYHGDGALQLYLHVRQ